MPDPFPISSAIDADEVYQTEYVNWWLLNLQPTPELAIIELNRLRHIKIHVDVQIAIIQGYVRDYYGLDELEPDPEILKSPYDWEDEDD